MPSRQASFSFVSDGEGLIVSENSSNGSAAFGWRVLRDDAGCVLLELVGELDIASAPELDRLLEAVAAEPPALVVVDLTGLRFMDSAGLHVLMDADAHQRRAGDGQSIVRGGAQVDRLCELTATETHLALVDRVPHGCWAVTPGTRSPGAQDDVAMSPTPAHGTGVAAGL